MALKWRDCKTNPPEADQDCLVKFKHGIMDGGWDAEEEVFRSYKFQDIEFIGRQWVPIEEVE